MHDLKPNAVLKLKYAKDLMFVIKKNQLQISSRAHDEMARGRSGFQLKKNKLVYVTRRANNVLMYRDRVDGDPLTFNLSDSEFADRHSRCLFILVDIYPSLKQILA